ncbi:MAG: putative DNA binding domain-containing protein [Bacteroidales bacterium]|jgi:ATP-dependent DNA helicase RecG|nr:putative DNA binding domain-containing protein [Bacteroidales bacterium]
MDSSFIIENLIKQEEGLRLEFIKQPNVDAIAKTITAFINTQGGDLIIGVDDDKTVVGVGDAFDQVDTIRTFLVENIKPTAPISVQVIEYEKKEVILISVWEGAKKPYLCNGVIYNRKGKTSIIPDTEELSEIISERKKSDFHWERMPVLGAELSDLDNSQIEKTILHYKEYKQDAVIDDIEDFLIQTGLIQNGNITNACIILFGITPIRFIPQSRIRLTLYPTDKTTNEFIDDRFFEGNIFDNIEKIFNYLDIIYGKTYHVNNLIREERPNYPALALREGIMNAIVHRDYHSVKGFMQVSIYSDRTEISNYGGLPKGITIPELKIEHNSILRNPDIAQICFYRKYIEMLGSGTLRMIKDCKSNKYKIPVWTDKNDITTVVFPNVSHNKKDKKIAKELSEKINEIVINAIEGLSEGLNEGLNAIKDTHTACSDFGNEELNEKPSEGLNEVKDRYNKILLVLFGKNGIQMTDIETLTGIPYKSLERYIKILRDKGIVERKGSKKTGGYHLSEEIRKKLIK